MQRAPDERRARSCAQASAAEEAASGRGDESSAERCGEVPARRAAGPQARASNCALARAEWAAGRLSVFCFLESVPKPCNPQISSKQDESRDATSGCTVAAGWAAAGAGAGDGRAGAAGGWAARSAAQQRAHGIVAREVQRRLSALKGGAEGELWRKWRGGGAHFGLCLDGCAAVQEQSGALCMAVSRSPMQRRRSILPARPARVRVSAAAVARRRGARCSLPRWPHRGPRAARRTRYGRV